MKSYEEESRFQIFFALRRGRWIVDRIKLNRPSESRS